MGVMVLVLTPCLYCNVSDSWMLPNKWHRAAIGAGGMYVELVLASLATWIWRYTEPGLLNHICLNTMFVCSVSTLMFNANPLLRYDGYYILADLTEIPNLRQKATSILNRKMSEWFLGMEQPEDPFLPQRNQMFFVFYSIAAAIYRWVVVFSILFFLYKVFQPYRLEKIGQLLALASLWGLFITPLYQLGKFFSVPGRFEQVKKTRMFASIGGAIAVVVVVLSIPLPHSVFAPFEIQPHGADPVYVNVAEGGVLVERLAYPGEKVTKGQLLARLESKDVDIEISKLMAKKDEYTTQLSNLRRKSDYDRNAPEQIPELQKQIEGVERQLAEKKADKQRLEIVAPCDGYVIPAPVTPREQHNDDEESQLPFWSGTPLDKENYRPYLKEGTLICQIGNPKDLEAVLVIEQGDMELVAPHQKVDIKLDALPHDTLQGTVDAVSEYNLRITPRRLTAKAGGDVASTTDPHTGAEHPQDSSYQARVAVVDTEGVIIPGQRGHAKIHTRPMSLGERLWLLIMRTFNFRLAA
jgi:putative peptide zinc metalloprotease protein